MIYKIKQENLVYWFASESIMQKAVVDGRLMIWANVVVDVVQQTIVKNRFGIEEVFDAIAQEIR